MIPSKLQLGLLLFVALATAPVVCAQEQGEAEKSKPIPVRKYKEEKKDKLEKYKGEVIFFNGQAVAVRSEKDERKIQTFSFTLELREHVFKMLEKGGFQPGDKITVYHEPGQTVAHRIKGKPSKP